MVYHVKGSIQIDHHNTHKFPLLHILYSLVVHLDQGCSCIVARATAMVIWMDQVVGVQEVHNLHEDSFLQDLAKDGQKCNWAVVFWY